MFLDGQKLRPYIPMAKARGFTGAVDNDYFLGGIYTKLGFTNKGQCKPRYYWFLQGIQIKREQCKLARLKRKYPTVYDEAITSGAKNKEDYIMVQLGAKKVYRSGNTKWEKFR